MGGAIGPVMSIKVALCSALCALTASSLLTAHLPGMAGQPHTLPFAIACRLPAAAQSVAPLHGIVHPASVQLYTLLSCSLPRSVLLKESFVDSFPPRDRPFMRQFAETQMFAVYTDAVLG